jgi:UDP-glucose 6-dehydrogenase
LRDRVEYCDSTYAACSGSKALVVANDDRAYAQLDFRRIAVALDGNYVIDLRNRLDPGALEKAGLQYVSFGRAPRRMPVL